jgi:hypothetical protein
MLKREERIIHSYIAGMSLMVTSLRPLLPGNKDLMKLERYLRELKEFSNYPKLTKGTKNEYKN